LTLDPLSSFPDGTRVAIFGATGAIGGAMLAQVRSLPRVAHVYALSRTPIVTSDPKVTAVAFDLGNEASIAAAAELCKQGGALHLVFVATGVLHSAALQPEKSWRAVSAEQLASSFAVNTIGPALIAKHFLELLATQEKSVFAAISARVGSISDNRLGGWHAYRAAKAALHQLIRNFAIELARRNRNAVCIAVHPGTVDSQLSKPFQANVPEGKLFTPHYSAERLLAVINHVTAPDSGGIFAWDRQRIEP
jgi:NAD(P)-dependent dehydrogenase (short-subunit alcohol dehydrogenase family)